MIGERIKQLRIEKNLLQDELANILGFSRQALSNYENETREPDAQTIEKIASYFNVSIDFIYGRTNIRNIDEHVLLENLHEWFNYDPKVLSIVETICNIVKKHPSHDKLNELDTILKSIDRIL